MKFDVKNSDFCLMLLREQNYLCNEMILVAFTHFVNFVNISTTIILVRRSKKSKGEMKFLSLLQKRY